MRGFRAWPDEAATHWLNSRCPARKDLDVSMWNSLSKLLLEIIKRQREIRVNWNWNRVWEQTGERVTVKAIGRRKLGRGKKETMAANSLRVFFQSLLSGPIQPIHQKRYKGNLVAIELMPTALLVVIFSKWHVVRTCLEKFPFFPIDSVCTLVALYTRCSEQLVCYDNFPLAAACALSREMSVVRAPR